MPHRGGRLSCCALNSPGSALLAIERNARQQRGRAHKKSPVTRISVIMDKRSTSDLDIAANEPRERVKHRSIRGPTETEFSNYLHRSPEKTHPRSAAGWSYGTPRVPV